MNKILSRTLSCLLLLALISSSAYGQGYDTTKWRFSNPKPLGFTTFDVDFLDNNNVLAVGSDGGIARSGNGGRAWTYGAFSYVLPNGSLTKSNLLDVHFVTSSIAYAVGSLGCAVKSTDGGKSWSFMNTPLYANSKNINTVWFVNKDTGYIGGQWNTLDSIPKVYFTKNGGATWDSLVSPMGGKTRVGYVNNAALPPLIWDVTGKGKEIHRIEFTSPTMGYIIGGGQSHFPAIPAASATSPCNPTGGTTSTTANNAPIVWKYVNGNLFDYSPSKERLGYSGINTNTIACNTQYTSQVTPITQTYKALNIINDSMIVIMSFNNNIVLRIRTGVNDNTVNMINGLPEPGKYEILNFPFPPTQGPQAGPAIPPTQVLLASNPYYIRRAANGKLNAAAGNGLMWTSIDTGKTWVKGWSLPQGQPYSGLSTPALDIAPNGKFLSMGAFGVFADSVPGAASWTTPYVLVPGGASSKLEFADCLNGISAGASVITVTTDGGNTWVDRTRADFTASFYSINGISYPNISKSYYAVSNGTLYRSADFAVTLDPLYSDFNYSFNDVAAVGNDTVYVLGYSQFSIPAANRKSTIFRSFNNGATWQAIDIAVTTAVPAFTAPTLREMSFSSKNVGYVAGTRNAIYKTTDGGSTWTSINPFPAINYGPPGFTNSFVTYADIFALDDNTVFTVGNMFTSTNNRRVYRSTDGGANWTDISGNIPTLPGGNLTGIMFHDINNGYVTIGGAMYKTTDGGVNWTIELAPSGTLFTTAAFAPKKVPAGITFANRKLFVAGNGVGGQAAIMEYGATSDVNVNSTEVRIAANCTNPSGGTITVNASGGLAPYTYSINGGPFQSSNVFSGLTQGTKTIAVKDAFCGILTRQVTVDFTDNLTLTTTPATDTSVCSGAPVPMIATSAATATYAWTPAAGLTNAAINNPVATVTGNTIYSVTASLNGCVRTKTIQIIVKPNPVVSAGPDKTIVEGGVTLLQGAASNISTIAWTPSATLAGATTLTPAANPLTTTTYTLSVKDNNGCTSTDNVLVTVIPYCLKPMEAFTPNGDGQNDVWMASTSAPCTSNIGVTVVNRYGNVIYKNDKYQNNWDGTYNGNPVPDGTYYFIIHYLLIDGTALSLKGNVTIIR
jgi:gliding motility-associated-like protein